MNNLYDKQIIICVAVFLSWCVFFGCDDPNVVHTEINIAESDVLHSMDGNMLGVNIGLEAYSRDVFFENSDTIRPCSYCPHDLPMGVERGTIKKEYKALAREKLYKVFNNSRVHGAPSCWFIYTDNIGPFSSRFSRPVTMYLNIDSANPMELPPEKTLVRSFGLDEWLEASYDLNPDMSFTICLNLVSGTAQQSADAAQYLTGDASTQWGAKRAAAGFEEPVKVAMYELGNEINWTFRSIDPMEYVRVAREHIAAVKAVDPTAKFAICGGNPLDWSTGPEGQDWRGWNQVLARELKDETDYITSHPYYGGTPLSIMEQYMDVLHKDVVDNAGRMLPIVHTEYAKWPDNMGEWSMDPIQLQGSLLLAEFYNRMYSRDDVWGADYFLATMEHDGYWSVFNYFGDSPLALSGIGHVCAAYAKGMGDKVIKLTVSGGKETDKKDVGCKFTALASLKGDQDMNIILVNRSDSTVHEISFSFDNKWKLMEETVFTAPSLTSYVEDAATVDIFTTVVTPKDVSDFEHYTMPEKSMVVLKLKKQL